MEKFQKNIEIIYQEISRWSQLFQPLQREKLKKICVLLRLEQLKRVERLKLFLPGYLSALQDPLSTGVSQARCALIVLHGLLFVSL